MSAWTHAIAKLNFFAGKMSELPDASYALSNLQTLADSFEQDVILRNRYPNDAFDRSWPLVQCPAPRVQNISSPPFFNFSPDFPCPDVPAPTGAPKKGKNSAS